MNNENIRIDYVIVQTFPITPLGFIVQGSYFLDVNVLVLSVSGLATKKKTHLGLKALDSYKYNLLFGILFLIESTRSYSLITDLI